MHDDLIQVHAEVLRGCAGELAGTGYRLGHGLGGRAGLAVPAPDWAAATALAAVESAVHAWFCAVGGRTAETATALRAAAEEYDAADERAARRLAGTR
jgi:hypothetical protein